MTSTKQMVKMAKMIEQIVKMARMIERIVKMIERKVNMIERIVRMIERMVNMIERIVRMIERMVNMIEWMLRMTRMIEILAPYGTKDGLLFNIPLATMRGTQTLHNPRSKTSISSYYSCEWIKQLDVKIRIYY
jgi:hypothetical protein